MEASLELACLLVWEVSEEIVVGYWYDITSVPCIDQGRFRLLPEDDQEGSVVHQARAFECTFIESYHGHRGTLT